MNMWAALVMIALIISIASVIGAVMTANLRAKQGLRKDWLGNEVPILDKDDGSKDVLEREVVELRERVKVLERIATDGRETSAIAEQIENLRDR